MDPFTLPKFDPKKAFQKIDVEKEAKIQSILILLKTDEFKNSLLKELIESNDISFIKNDEIITKEGINITSNLISSSNSNNSKKIFISLYNKLLKTINLHKFQNLQNVNLEDLQK